jgi:hypothetical protein
MVHRPKALALLLMTWLLACPADAGFSRGAAFSSSAVSFMAEDGRLVEVSVSARQDGISRYRAHADVGIKLDGAEVYVARAIPMWSGIFPQLSVSTRGVCTYVDVQWSQDTGADFRVEHSLGVALEGDRVIDAVFDRVYPKTRETVRRSLVERQRSAAVRTDC